MIRKLMGMDDAITVKYKLTIDGDKLKGKGAAEFGVEEREYDIEGRRIPARRLAESNS